MNADDARGGGLLSQPLRVGGLTLKNRLVMGPMADSMWVDGAPAPGLFEYFAVRAHGGAAAITLGATEVHPHFEVNRRGSLAADHFIPALQTLTAQAHAAGTLMLIQLHQGGSSGKPAISPSGVSSLSTLKAGFMESRALTVEEIRDLRDHFIAAAVRARRAGFDGVQLAGQAGYLLGQFFSPRLNQRDDDYGGSEPRRMTLALEIVAGIRAACGADFGIGYAISADELRPQGVVPEGCVPFAQALERSGLDYLDVRVGTHESFATSDRATGHSRFQSRAGIFDAAAVLKRALRIPVFCSAQGCYDPALWQQALAGGQIDVIQLGKVMLADPALPRKLLAGRDADVRPCIYCMHCLDPITNPQIGPRSYCAINAETGAEWRMTPTPAAKVRHIAVVGGGPAGLEVARIAAERGHRVTLFEQASELGGNLRFIGRALGGDAYLHWRDWLVRQCNTAGVNLQVGRIADIGVLRAAAPDHVVLATGAVLRKASIKGSDHSHVYSVQQVLAGQATIGDIIAVIGGGQAGLLAAATLARDDSSRQVTIIDAGQPKMLGDGMAMMERAQASMTLLPKLKVQALLGIQVVEIRPQDLLLIEGGDKRKQKLKADTVVMALPGEPDAPLAGLVREAQITFDVIGDAAQLRDLGAIVHEAAQLAMQL